MDERGRRAIGEGREMSNNEVEQKTGNRNGKDGSARFEWGRERERNCGGWKCRMGPKNLNKSQDERICDIGNFEKYNFFYIFFVYGQIHKLDFKNSRNAESKWHF